MTDSVMLRDHLEVSHCIPADVYDGADPHRVHTIAHEYPVLMPHEHDKSSHPIPMGYASTKRQEVNQ